MIALPEDEPNKLQAMEQELRDEIDIHIKKIMEAHVPRCRHSLGDKNDHKQYVKNMSGMIIQGKLFGLQIVKAAEAAGLQSGMGAILAELMEVGYYGIMVCAMEDE